MAFYEVNGVMDFRIAVVMAEMTRLANIDTIFKRVAKIAGGGFGEIMVKTRHRLITDKTGAIHLPAYLLIKPVRTVSKISF